MQYPGTIDNWFDHSGIQARVTVTPDPAPLFLHAAAFDRGPEKITRVKGENFYKLFGYFIDFDKYGQAGIQAAKIIDSGGELLLKRVVAEDATLANICVVANVSTDKVQKTDEKGNPLFVDPNTNKETTANGDGAYEKVMVNVAKIKYDLITVAGKKTAEDIEDELLDSFVEDEDSQTFSYPLFYIVDNGRGESTKRFGIQPMYAISKNGNYMIYKLKYLGSEDFDAEYCYFSLVHNILYLEKSLDIEMSSSSMLQGSAKALSESVAAFYVKLSEISGLDLATLYAEDVLFARSNRGDVTTGLSYDDNGQDISTSTGFQLLSGDNGSFGDKPIDTDEYNQALLDFFSGEYDENIYNLDMYKPDVCVDANYPYDVKKKIVALADFRKDFYVFADLGLDIETFYNAKDKMYEMPQSKFCSWYGQTFLVMNPFTKRNVKVTNGYALAGTALVNQLNNSRNAPYCGIINGFMFPEIVEGSLSWTPKITPTVNQKEECDNIRLNYMSILNDVPTLETEFSSQDAYTQLSFANNVIAIQAIIKDIRDNCPKFRYSFISTNDLTEYKNNVSEILNRYNSWFESLEFVYVQDDIMKANKIFEADIKIRHKDFVQAEIFNIYTLGNDTAVEASSDTSFVAASGSSVYNPYI